MPSMYKIYMMILAERLKKEIVERRMIPEWQTEFKKGRGVINNIYTLNYLMEKEMARKEKIVAIFIDLKAAFDSVDRRVLGKSLEERGVSKD